MDITRLKEELIRHKAEVLKDGKSLCITKPLLQALEALESYCLYTEQEKKSEWICDNLYLIRQTVYELKKNRRHLPLRSLKAAEVFLSLSQKAPDKASVEALFQVYCTEDGLNDREIRAIQDAMFFDIVLELKEGLAKNADNAQRLITTLFWIRDFDFYDFIIGYSPLERALRCDPSGVYPKMDRSSQDVYREAIHKKARRNRISPHDLAQNLLLQAEKNHCGLGELLLHNQKEGWIKPFGISLFVMLGILCLGGIFQATRPLLSLAWGVFLLPFVYRATVLFVQYFAGIFVAPKPILKLRVEQCPPEAKTCVAITGMVTSAQEVQGLYERLERFYLSQFPQGKRDPNVYFGLIADLAVNKKKVTPEDAVIREQITFCCDQLNRRYGSGFFGYLREREFAKSEQSYCGKERKRGAILEFARDSLRGSGASRWLGDRSVCKKPKYLITLDSDTTMGFRQIYALIGAMLHPLNRPIITQKHKIPIVERGYGILQPSVGSSLESASCSPLSVLLSGAGGREPYHSGAFDFFQDCFGVGMFCGKGILDLEAYHRVCSDAFPEGIVLSHDILEGSRLRCGYLRDEQFTDGVPSGTLSMWARRHRWIRGDVQALSFAKKRIPTSQGAHEKNPINGVYRFVLWDNVISDLLPFHLLITLLLSTFFHGALSWRICAVAIAPFLLPPILSLLGLLIKGEWARFSRCYRSKVLASTWTAILHFLHQCSSVVTDAFVAADAAFRSLWRLCVSRRKLLEWTTFSAWKGSGSFWAHVKKNLPSLILGGIFVVLGSNRPIRLFALLWILYPFTSYLLSKPYRSPEKLSRRHTQRVREYLKASFSFFEANVNQSGNFLPPDNISLSPCESTAYRCSPTNIGMYLLSLLAARDERILTSAQLALRIHQTLSTVERLEKFHGNLYNWYDTATGAPLGKRYISTVDSGNLVVSLVALAEGLREYYHEEHSLRDLISRIETLVRETSFDFLYDSKKHLFFIGYDCQKGTPDKNHYDMYMSEARMTSFYCVAKGIVPSVHWQRLRRNLLQSNHRIGAASWTGTCFEYFMPTLLLPVFPNGFEFESLDFACREQQKYSFGNQKVFGVSESGFFAFDSDMNYQYRAFGIPSLRLKRENEASRVVSPYSSFLMLRESPGAMIENLERIKRLGGYGKYGFYEAIDFEPSRTGGSAIVKSYMTHHVGMSIVAAANFLHNDRFVKRFCADPSVAAALVLLEEKLPVDAIVMKSGHEKLPDYHYRERLPSNNETRLVRKNQYFLYPGKACSLLIASNGENRFFYYNGGKPIGFDRPLGVGENNGITVRIQLGELTFSNRKKENPEGSVFCSYCFDEAMDFCIRYRKIFLRIRFTPLTEFGSSLGISVRVKGYTGLAKSSVECRPLLSEYDPFFSHPVFSDLFLQLYPSRDDPSIMIVRRPRGTEEEHCCVLGFSSGDNSQSTYSYGEPSVYERERVFTPECQPVSMLYSQLKITQRKMLRTQSSAPSFVFCVSCGNNREDTRSSFLASIEQVSGAKKQTRPRSFSSIYSPYCTGTVRESENALLQKCFYHNLTKLKNASDSWGLHDLWAYGISGDYPILCVDYHKVKLQEFSEFLQRKRVHSLCGIYYDLVILVECGGYRREAFDSLGKLLFEAKAGFLLGARGGIHPVDHSEENQKFFRDISDLYWGETTPRIPPMPNYHPQVAVSREKTSDGIFCSEGFLIQKKSSFNPPWSHVLCSGSAGTLVTDRSLGYSWWSNCALKRLSYWENDPFAIPGRGETLLMEFPDGKYYDVIQASDRVSYFAGVATYFGSVRGINYKAEVLFHPTYSYKKISLTLKAQHSLCVKIGYRLVPIMGAKTNYPSRLGVSRERGVYHFRRLLREEGFDGVGFIFTDGFGRETDPVFYRDSGIAVFREGLLEANQTQTLSFSLGIYHSQKQLECIQESIPRFSKDDSVAFVRKVLTPKNMNGAMDSFYPFWLSYQTVFARSLAKSGFYQSGGAIGFRDQLQDSLIYLSFSPDVTKRMLIRCASHQFKEGDVLHWWHNCGSGSHKGVRTQCSDDYLWLILVLCEYLRKTKDYEIINFPVPYLEGEPLGGDGEIYNAFSFSLERAPLMDHVYKMLDLFFQRGFGKKGFPLMGSGDWNDGMNFVGKNGGESVWLGMFSVLVFSFLCDHGILDDKYEQKLRDYCEQMGHRLDSSFNGRWYPRAWFGDGTALGNDPLLKSECSLDLLPQCFSVFLYHWVPAYRNEARKEQMIKACDWVYRILFCKKERVLRLFAPSFQLHEPNPGYIRSYSEGVRENGGQYTHAAVWYCWALYLLSKHVPELKEQLLLRLSKVMDAISPAKTAGSEEMLSRYRNEPYVLSGDVYWTNGGKGRGGWSWYTGSSGWFYRLLEQIEQDQRLETEKES